MAPIWCSSLFPPATTFTQRFQHLTMYPFRNDLIDMPCSLGPVIHAPPLSVARNFAGLASHVCQHISWAGGKQVCFTCALQLICVHSISSTHPFVTHMRVARLYEVVFPVLGG